MINIGIDASGGDNGEGVVVKAVIQSISLNTDLHFTIFGNEDNIKNEFSKCDFDYNTDYIKIVNCRDIILMNDHPVISIRTKTNSSIVVASNYLKEGKIDAFISAGSSGALVAASLFIVKPIKGVERPVLGAIVPTKTNPMLLVDSGCNMDSKPEWLYQYTLLANCYYKLMFGVDRPRIGLLSVGTEANKGNLLSLSAYKLIYENKDFNFIGNVEARDLPYGICDIIIADGFSGNVFLKTYEGTASFLFGLIKEQIKSSFVSKIGGLLIKPSLKKLLSVYNAKVYGGAPILGCNNLIIKCHGNSTESEFIYAVRQAYELTRKSLIKVLISNFME